MRRVHLIFILRLFAGEYRVERPMLTLIPHRAMAARHFADLKMQQAGNGFQIFGRASHHRIRGFRFGRVRPEDDDV